MGAEESVLNKIISTEKFLVQYTDKKENKIFLIRNSDRIGCKVIYEEGLPNYEEIHKYFHYI
jgi:hypothetical protein